MAQALAGAGWSIRDRVYRAVLWPLLNRLEPPQGTQSVGWHHDKVRRYLARVVYNSFRNSRRLDADLTRQRAEMPLLNAFEPLETILYQCFSLGLKPDECAFAKRAEVGF